MCELLQSLAVTPEPPTGARVGIIGLGYVGLPLAVAFAEAGADVVGIDVDPSKVEAIAAGRSYIEDVASGRLQGLTSAGRIRATTDASGPRRSRGDPHLPAHAARRASVTRPRLRPRRGRDRHRAPRPGRPPRPRVDDLAGHDPGGHRADAGGAPVGRSARTASSPSARSASIPGNTRWGIRETPKVVGGMTAGLHGTGACPLRARRDTVHVVSSPESAELAKIIENTFRAVNIALVNELAILADRMGIDVWESIGAAATKPFGFMPFWPGPGLGGHCIPVDPFYLAWRAKAFDMDFEFVELAGRINVNMPYYAVSADRAGPQRPRPSRSADRASCSWAWPTRQDVGDTAREPVAASSSSCCARRAPRSTTTTRTCPRCRDGTRSVALDATTIGAADCVVIATAHSAVDLALVVEQARLVVDLRNAVRQRLTGHRRERAGQRRRPLSDGPDDRAHPDDAAGLDRPHELPARHVLPAHPAPPGRRGRGVGGHRAGLRADDRAARALRDRAHGHRATRRRGAQGQGTGSRRRSTALARFGRGRGFTQAVSHGSNDLAVAARLLRLHSTILHDYEGATGMHRINFRLADKVMVPRSSRSRSCARSGFVSAATGRTPGSRSRSRWPTSSPTTARSRSSASTEDTPIAVLRPPATMSLYHRGLENTLFDEVLRYLRTLRRPGRAAAADARPGSGPAFDPGVIVPVSAVDGPSLVWAADLVVSAGGTMNREAAVLGVPTWTTFAGRAGGGGPAAHRGGAAARARAGRGPRGRAAGPRVAPAEGDRGRGRRRRSSAPEPPGQRRRRQQVSACAGRASPRA